MLYFFCTRTVNGRYLFHKIAQVGRVAYQKLVMSLGIRTHIIIKTVTHKKTSCITCASQLEYLEKQISLVRKHMKRTLTVFSCTVVVFFKQSLEVIIGTALYFQKIITQRHIKTKPLVYGILVLKT